MTNSQLCKACPTKPGRRNKAEIQLLKDSFFAILEERHPQTVRQLFYQAVSAGLIDKTDAAYQGIVVRLCGQMREDGELPWSWIADSTRWMRKPRAYSSLEEAIARTAETYRRALWDDQNAYVEVWCEKEALAGVLYEITAPYDVPLMVVKGFPSKDFVHSAAQTIEGMNKPSYLYYFGDWDPSGLVIWNDIQSKIQRYAPSADVRFQRGGNSGADKAIQPADTPDQIRTKFPRQGLSRRLGRGRRHTLGNPAGLGPQRNRAAHRQKATRNHAHCREIGT